MQESALLDCAWEGFGRLSLGSSLGTQYCQIYHPGTALATASFDRTQDSSSFDMAGSGSSRRYALHWELLETRLSFRGKMSCD